jgi:hypothetical protein
MTYDQMIDDAREWLAECFEDQAEEIAEASASIIRHNVERYYDGGWVSFVTVCDRG